MKRPWTGSAVQAIRMSKFIAERIAFALKQSELGISGVKVCRKIGISETTSYVWRKEYGGVGPESRLLVKV